MVKKTVREKNEDCWGVPGWSIPAYSKVIDYVKRKYKDSVRADCSSSGEGYSDKCLREQISVVCSLPIEIVNEYLVNMEFLDDECDGELSDARLSRQEYNYVMEPVERVSLHLRQDDLTDTEIRPWITNLVKGMLNERKKHGSINRTAWVLDWKSRIGYKKKDVKASTKPSRVPRKKNFSYSPGATKAVFGPKTVEEIQKKFCQISRDLENLPAIDPDSVEPFKKGLVQAVCNLAGIGVSLTDLEKNHNREVTDGNTN